jgi:acyl-CoA thioester hydrolase
MNAAGETPSHPIVYRTTVPIRFTDVDRYGHVATAQYVEYVFTHRFDFIRERFGAGPEVFAQRGVGFYVRRMEMDFLRPIPASQREVALESFVSTLEGGRFVVDCKIQHPSGDPLHSSGRFEFRTIDLQKGAPCPVPDWLREWFFSSP